MKTHLTFLLSTCAGLMTLSAAQAAPVPPQPIATPQSYAELLEPVQNANEVIVADDLARTSQPRPLLNLVQWHHHHHHHHHHGFFPGFGLRIGPPAYAYGPDCYIQRRVYVNRFGERVVRRVRVCD